MDTSVPGDLVTLIHQKIARHRFQGLAEVVDLIRTHNLDEAFLKRLHSSWRKDFIGCLEEIKRDEQYEALQ